MSYRLLSVIIPVYNEESTIGELLRRVFAVKLSLDKEIVVVNDGSTDRTTELLNGASELVDKLCALPFNQGKGSAIRNGLTMVTGDVILLQDADLELDPDEYSRLLEPILQGHSSVVYGSRFLTRQPGIHLSRYFGNRLLTAVTNLLYGTCLSDMETAYKVFTAEVALRMNLQSTGFEIEPEITSQIICLGYGIHEVPISYRPRAKSEGKKIRWYDGFTALRVLWKNRLRFRLLGQHHPISASHD